MPIFLLYSLLAFWLAGFFSFYVGKKLYFCTVKHPEARKGEGWATGHIDKTL